MGECELYGGWLVQINDLKEYNCLMRHRLKEETLAWDWTDGNDRADAAVWTHAHDNSEVTFFSPKIRCLCSDKNYSCSDSAVVMLSCSTLETISNTEETIVTIPQLMSGISYVKQQFE